MIKYIMPSIEHRTVKSVDDLRVEMAQKQLKKYEKQKQEGRNKDKNAIAELVNEFLDKIGISINENFNNIVTVKSIEVAKRGRISYSRIQQESGIRCKQDIVWIKFNVNGCISVIGTGCDIYFTQKVREETSAGKINIFLGQNWDETSVLVFPLKDLDKSKYSRSDIESGIGNYLIANDVPILDYYSHNY